MDIELLAVKLDRHGGEVCVEEVRAEVAGEFVLRQAERIDDAWQHRLLHRLPTRLVGQDI